LGRSGLSLGVQEIAVSDDGDDSDNTPRPPARIGTISSRPHDAANDDNTRCPPWPEPLPTQRVHGLLGDLDAHRAASEARAAAGQPAPITAFDRWVAGNLQHVVVGVLAKAPLPTLLQADADEFAQILYGTPAPAGEPHTAHKAAGASADPAPELFPAAMVEGEGINLQFPPPQLPRYQEGGPFQRASKSQMDACITKLTELAGGTLQRPLLRAYGRHWLRRYRHVDANSEELVNRRKQPKHRASRGARGRPRR
jgi:hypothetical protein